jgi:hypothetical protein
MLFIYTAEFRVLECVRQNIVSHYVFTISYLAYTKKIEGMQSFIYIRKGRKFQAAEASLKSMARIF